MIRLRDIQEQDEREVPKCELLITEYGQVEAEAPGTPGGQTRQRSTITWHLAGTSTLR
jgi:hypothetical protein